MTQAITARRDGDTYQARLFWDRAARLLDENSSVVKVGFEVGPKSFDDIWVEYEKGKGPADQFGVPLRREHLQCKWHSTPNTYGHAQLINPEFINANVHSFLERARKAQVEFAPDGMGIRFKLVTNWRLDLKDPLREMVSTRSGAIRLDQLYGTKTDNSKAGAVRKAWREHLGIDENEVRILARTLAFGEVTDSLQELRDRLDMTFRAMGLQSVPVNKIAFFYDDLVYQWMGQKRLVFDRRSFREACDQEGILVTSTPATKVFGIKSFEHAFDHLEDRCEKVLNFVPVFDERYIRSDTDWSSKLYPDLTEFLVGTASNSDRLRLALDAHTTLAFAAGSILNIKSGRTIELEQRILSKSVWTAEDLPLDPKWPHFEFSITEIDPVRPEMSVAVGVTHDIEADVLTFVEQSLPTVGRILSCIPNTGPGARSVVCGSHAFDLAETLVKKVVELRRGRKRRLIHLFIAAPNTFTFFLGQRQVALGPTLLYEFDFEGYESGTYRPSLTLPINHLLSDLH